MIWLSLALSYCGFIALSLAMGRHGQQVTGHVASAGRQQWYRRAGWLLLAGSILPCLTVWGLSVALAAWLALITVSAAMQVLTLTYAPALALRFGMSALGMAAVAAAGIMMVR